jgi:asparagine synthase (glutamine-hydrolysing)
VEAKEQFSDGVGYSWIDTLKEVVAVEVSDEQLANANISFSCKHQHQRGILLSFSFMNIFSDAAAYVRPQEASVVCSTKLL